VDVCGNCVVFASSRKFQFRGLSSARAYVGGESLWSKAQKDAVFHLQNYARSRSPEELKQFRANIAIPLGDHEARVEMDKSDPDFEKVWRDFLLGGIHRDDITGMFNLYRRFEWMDFMQRAIRAWETGDRYIVQLEDAGTRLQRETESPMPSAATIQSISTEISRINENLTPVEIQFDEALSEASRMTYRLLRAVMLAAAPGLLIFGILLSLRILQQKKRTEDWVNYLAFQLRA